MLSASVSVDAFFMLSMVSVNASSALFPSAVASWTAFFIPASAVVVSTPFASICASKLTDDAQKEVAAAVEAGADVKSEEIKQLSEEGKKKRKTAEDIAKEQNVSDTDTNEEEKANAKKLHALKMLEKYYIYLSEEERGILERMLEDCKRRKREYSLEED